MGACIEDDCERPAHCRGFCKRHYRHVHYREHERARRGHVETATHPIGTTKINAEGYIQVKTRKGQKRWPLQHRLVMEVIIGRSLRPDETVHHRNGIHSDNRPENLELWSSRHPKGQRVEDLLEFAREILSAYGDMPCAA